MKKITILLAAVLLSVSFTFASDVKTCFVTTEISADSIDLNEYV